MKKEFKRMNSNTVTVKFAESMSPIIVAYNQRKKKRKVSKIDYRTKKALTTGLISGCVFNPQNPSSVTQEGSISICKYVNSSDAISTDSVTFQGGERIIGIDVVPIFYGSAWLTSNPSVQKVMDSIQKLFSTPYLSQMIQYGFSSLNVRQPILITNVNLNATHNSNEIGDIVWNLIDNDIFPEPDDAGGRNLYMVFYPAGTGVSDIQACGWHSAYKDYDFPFEVDWVWVGAVEFPQGNGSATPDQTLGNIIRIFSHELIEMISDPESDKGWAMNRSLNGGTEIGDACNISVDFTSGVFAQAYWSEKHKACIIPKFNVYVNISLETHILSSSLITSGIVHFDPSKSIFNCLSGDYKWTSNFNATKTFFTANPSVNLISPAYQWTLQQRQYGNPNLQNGFSGTVYIKAETTYEDVNDITISTRTFPVEVTVKDNIMIVINQDPGNQFSFTIEAQVEGSHGAAKATFKTSVNIQSQSFLYEDSYYESIQHCKDLLNPRYKEKWPKIPHLGPDDRRWAWIDRISNIVAGNDLILAAEVASLAAAFQEKDPHTAYQLRRELAALTKLPISLFEPVQLFRGKIIKQ